MSAPPLDERTRELVAVAASVAANCLPCLRYHAGQAEKLGISRPEMREVAEIARQVKRRPAADMDQLIESLLSNR
jgi:AhpD family alkylhydroperoxidase